MSASRCLISTVNGLGNLAAGICPQTRDLASGSKIPRQFRRHDGRPAQGGVRAVAEDLAVAHVADLHADKLRRTGRGTRNARPLMP
jgi:hypothetical protein